MQEDMGNAHLEACCWLSDWGDQVHRLCRTLLHWAGVWGLHLLFSDELHILILHMNIPSLSAWTHSDAAGMVGFKRWSRRLGSMNGNQVMPMGE